METVPSSMPKTTSPAEARKDVLIRANTLTVEAPARIPGQRDSIETRRLAEAGYPLAASATVPGAPSRS